ncbi:MAG: Crp/Fnr family transcriptional regulator [Bacteroidales bacterium]|nr:Crp/Fnr family transcriptional regulator [Bacteroidales bacterium]
MAKIFKQSDCNQCKKRIEVFKVLREEDFKIIDEKRYEVLYHSGETIFKQGTSFTHTICILEGLIKVYLETRKRKNFILSLIGPGEMIGSPGMFTDNMHHFSVVAVEDTLACHVERQAIEELIRTNALFAIEMQKRSNLRDIRHYRKFRTLAQKQMPGRVAEVILYLYNSIYKSNPYTLTITRQDIADLASITKEGTIRVLKDFKDAELISLNGNELKILNEKALFNISENG